MSFQSSGDQESRLRQFVQFLGLPGDAVCLIRSENWDEVLKGVNSRDRRPLVIEFGSGMDYSSLRVWLDSPWRDHNSRAIFFFGSGTTGSYQNPETGFSSGTPRRDRINIPIVSEIRFSDDTLWGPVQSFSLRRRTTIGLSNSGLSQRNTSRSLRQIIASGQSA